MTTLEGDEALPACEAEVEVDASRAHRQDARDAGLAGQHGLAARLRGRIRRLRDGHPRMAIEVQVTTANARVQSTLDFNYGR